MGYFLHYPGATVVIGISGFATSFIAIGLAIRASDKDDTLLGYSYGAFGLAAFLLVVAAIAIVALVRHDAKTKEYIRQIGLYLRQGYPLCEEMLGVASVESFSPELAKRALQWEAEVQSWQDRNLPDYAPDFGLPTLTGTSSYFHYDEVNSEASTAPLRVESGSSNLREILRDIRR